MSIVEKAQMIKDMDLALDAIRPHLKVDGGNVQVVGLTDDFKVQIKWFGNCENCSMSAMTMRAGIEETLKGKFPNITSVEAIN